jgi:hypothetical protein
MFGRKSLLENIQLEDREDDGWHDMLELRNVRSENVRWIKLAQDRVQRQILVLLMLRVSVLPQSFGYLA